MSGDLRVGVVGLGNWGKIHCDTLRDGRAPGAVLTAVAARPERATAVGITGNVAVFPDATSLFASGKCDAVTIATPHLTHPALTIAALRAGLHVFCEKPAAVLAADAREMAAVARETGKTYALNFSRRTVPLYCAIHETIRSGALGELHRFVWTSTAWLRVQAYYDSSAWRGTWTGDGGGLLSNQLPHIFDLWQWIFGMPARVWASCGFGRFHDLEVEDEVHAVAEYAGGAKGVLIGSTGEAPGCERLEIVGDRGTLVAENHRLTITRVQPGLDEFIRTAPGQGFPKPDVETQVIEPASEGDLMGGALRDFVRSVHENTPPLVTGEEGIASLSLANAFLLSAWQGNAWIPFPLDDAAFALALGERQAASRQRPARA